MAVCVIASALGVRAQTPQTFSAQTPATPLLGMVLDRDASRLRPIYGVPGAATLGATLETGNDISAAAVSASGRYALVISGSDSHAALLFPDGPSETPLNVAPGVSEIALSPAGTAATLYYSSERMIRVLSGLPDAPLQSRSIDVSALPSGKLLAAVSDDGLSVLCSAGTYEVFILGGESGFKRLALNGAPSALAFRRGSRDAMIATPAGAEWIDDTTARASVKHIALGKDSLSASFIGISRDGLQGFFMESTGRISLAALNSADRSGAESLNCNCAEFAPQPAAGGTGYILSEYKGKSISLLDAGSNPPRIFTIPPATVDGRLP